MRHASIGVFVLTLALAGCNLHGRPTIERKARPIGPAGAAATETVDPDIVVSPGIVEPWDAQVDLSAQESGRIARIIVKEGDIVRKGQLLATLDDEAERHNVDLGRAEVAEAEAALARIEGGATPEELRQAQADYDAAAARDDLARAAAGRMKRLHTDAVVSDAEFDRAAADARAESAAAERAAARLAEMKRGARDEDRRAARARVVAARARSQVADDSLARRQVVAPANGTVLLSRLHAGEFYNAGSGPLFVLGDMTRLQIRLEVDEIDASVPTRGASCTVYSDSGTRLAEGTIVRLAPKMGRRALPLESPTARADVRVREVFVQVPFTATLIPNQRVWGHVARTGKLAEERKGTQP
jgi:multidrug resistance efflux pump